MEKIKTFSLISFDVFSYRRLICTLVSQSLLYSFPHSGFLADKLGSYVIPFRVAGGITIAGSFIPIILLCYQRHQRTTSILYEHEGEKLLNNSSEADYETITNDESKI